MTDTSKLKSVPTDTSCEGRKDIPGCNGGENTGLYPITKNNQQ